MRLIGCILLGLCTVLLAADEEPAKAPEAPRSPQAVAALAKYDRAIKAAANEYHNAAVRAGRVLAGELKIAQKLAMKATDLDEANRIEAVIKTVDTQNTAEPAVANPLPAPSVWELIFENGYKNQYTIEPSGIITSKDGNAHCKLRREAGGSYLAYWNSKQIERLTFLNGRLYVEDYLPGSLFPDKMPSHLGMGKRTK